MNTLAVTPILANALSFAFEKATTEGKVTILLLIIVSLFSWDGHYHQSAPALPGVDDGQEILCRLPCDA